MRLRTLALFCPLLVLPFPLLADTTTTYTGNQFTKASGPLTTSDFDSGSFTVSSHLAANMTLGDIPPTSFSFYLVGGRNGFRS
jgi:hypothetical protein